MAFGTPIFCLTRAGRKLQASPLRIRSPLPGFNGKSSIFSVYDRRPWIKYSPRIVSALFASRGVYQSLADHPRMMWATMKNQYC